MISSIGARPVPTSLARADRSPGSSAAARPGLRSAATSGGEWSSRRLLIARASPIAGVTADEKKEELYKVLEEVGGEPKDPKVTAALDALEPLSKRCDPASVKGTFQSISAPDFPDCLGVDEKGRHMYTMARMSFGMFQPGDTKVAIDSIKNVVDDAPGGGLGYVVECRFEVLDGPAAGVKGVMSTGGTCEPLEEGGETVGGRMLITFTGGTVQPQNSEDVETWLSAFGSTAVPPTRKRDRLAAWIMKALLGIEKPMGGADGEGVQEFKMLRSPAGHHDIIYADDDLRVTRGNRGSIVIARREANVPVRV